MSIPLIFLYSETTMAPTKCFLPLIISFFLLSFTCSVSATETTTPKLEDQVQEEFGSFEDFKSWEDQQGFESSTDDSIPATFDEKDVVVLNNTNFVDIVNKNKHVMVEFYAPWCGYCQSLAPEFAAAASELKASGYDVVLAKVDAIEETGLTDEYKIGKFPTIYLFSDGQHVSYEGERTKDAIVSWLRKKTGFAVRNVTSLEEAGDILAGDQKIVLAFLHSLTGADNHELQAAAEMEDDVNFFQTVSLDVAKIFGIDPEAKRPALVLLKKEAEKLSVFDGTFTKSAIIDFVSAKKHPLVIQFSRQNLELIFENPRNKQMLLFAPNKELANVLPSFEEAAIAFKENLVFVYVDTDNEDYGQAMIDHFGIEGDSPRVLIYAGHLDGRKFQMNGDITLSNIKSFADNFLADKLQPFYKSDPVPETNDGDVKVIVGKNFDEIVLDESKDVILEIYATWCRHCHAFEPIYNRLATYMSGVDSIIIAKMDGVRNEHPLIKVNEYPTILFFPARKNSSKYRMIVDTDRTAGALYKFLKQHASFPFETSDLEDDEETVEAVINTKSVYKHNDEL